jgi:hypothetical protein
MRSVLAIAVLAFVPGSALAVGLDVLDAGGTLTSGNGELSFSEFDVVRTGSIGSDLSLISVEALADGLAITGPMQASGGAAGDLFIQFRVSSSQPLQSVSLAMEGDAAGTGSLASVVETFEEPDNIQPFVFTTGGGSERLQDSRALDGVTVLRVSKDIVVDASAEGQAQITRIEQHFSTTEVPEPQGLLILGLALLAVPLVRPLLH